LKELNHQQQSAHDLIAGSRQNFFLSGIAGSGKTHVLREIIGSLFMKKRRVAITSFTGLAAQHLNGTTISKLLGLGLATTPDDFLSVNIERAEKNLHGITDLVIDEISMVSGDFLELIDQVMQEATGKSEPFGGIRLILGGDFMQLPPISPRGSEFRYPWAFEYPAFGEIPAIFLTENVRNASLFETDMLNEWRQGILTPSGREFLVSLVRKPGPLAVDLYPLRRDVAAVNDTRLAIMPGTAVIYPTTFSQPDKKQNLLAHIPIGEAVALKKGAPVLILMNDPKGKFVNGSQGVVTRLSDEAVEVQLKNGEHVWVQYKTWDVTDQMQGTIGSATGLPIALGWAATIHRAQGMTLDEVVTDVSRCWEPGQAYVALSRTRALENMSLLSPVKKIKIDPVALSYVNSLF